MENPLYIAAMMEGDQSTLQLKILLDHGGNPNLENPIRREPAIIAAININNENVNLLISYGADLEKKISQVIQFY
jgi:ankyrin repeat protein